VKYITKIYFIICKIFSRKSEHIVRNSGCASCTHRHPSVDRLQPNPTTRFRRQRCRAASPWQPARLPPQGTRASCHLGLGLNYSFTEFSRATGWAHAPVALHPNRSHNCDSNEVAQEPEPANDSPPPHACRYCGQHDPAAVVLCDQCNRWFCNRHEVSGPSHIIFHMNKSKHTECTLHNESPHGKIRQDPRATSGNWCTLTTKYSCVDCRVLPQRTSLFLA